MTLPRIVIEPQAEVPVSRLWATREEWACTADFAPRRQREYLAWRMIVRREIGVWMSEHLAAGGEWLDALRSAEASHSSGASHSDPALHAEGASLFSDAPSPERPFPAPLTPQSLAEQIAIDYTEVGAPCLRDIPIYISVSHSADRVAVAFSAEPCAVDIESTERNFARVKDHYLTAEEQRLADDPRWLATAWSAKETLYKYAGRDALDLVRDLHLGAVDFASGRIVARIADAAPVTITFSFRPAEHLVVTTIL